MLVYSPLMDYTQNLYRERATGRRVPFGAYQDLSRLSRPPPRRPGTPSAVFRAWTRIFCAVSRRISRTRARFRPPNFSRTCAGSAPRCRPPVPIFFLNGAEIEVPGSGETGARQRHETMNQALAEFVASAENCFLIDVRDFVQTPADVSNNLRHYHRQHYRTLAQRLAQAIGQWQGQRLAHSSWTDLKARAWGLVPAKLRGLLGS